MHDEPLALNNKTRARLLDVALSPLGATVELRDADKEAGDARLTLTGERAFVLGRGFDCDVRFESDRHARVSLRHVEITIAGEAVWLRDLDSRNGTFVNDVRLDGVAHLSDGDVVTLGQGGPRLRVGIYGPPTSVDDVE